ncbi:MAG TPA: hypothetical protein PKA10_13700 [Selenomonadales bacterium]|nr:hypothetical protein [Selenomonadales bacterium]
MTEKTVDYIFLALFGLLLMIAIYQFNWLSEVRDFFQMPAS